MESVRGDHWCQIWNHKSVWYESQMNTVGMEVDKKHNSKKQGLQAVFFSLDGTNEHKELLQVWLNINA